MKASQIRCFMHTSASPVTAKSEKFKLPVDPNTLFFLNLPNPKSKKEKNVIDAIVYIFKCVLSVYVGNLVTHLPQCAV